MIGYDPNKIIVALCTKYLRAYTKNLLESMMHGKRYINTYFRRIKRMRHI